MNSFVSSVNAKQHVHGQNTGLYAKSLPAMLLHNTSPSHWKRAVFCETRPGATAVSEGSK